MKHCILTFALAVATAFGAYAQTSDSAPAPESRSRAEGYGTYWDEAASEGLDGMRRFEVAFGVGMAGRIGAKHPEAADVVFGTKSSVSELNDFSLAWYPWRNWGVVYQHVGFGYNGKWLDMPKGMFGFPGDCYVNNMGYECEGGPDGYAGYGVAYRYGFDKWTLTAQLNAGVLYYASSSYTAYAKEQGSNQTRAISIGTDNTDSFAFYPKAMVDYQFSRYFAVRGSLGMVVPTGNISMAYTLYDVYLGSRINSGNISVYPGTFVDLNIGLVWKFGSKMK